MPGIVGIITKASPQQAREDVRRMVDAIRHEDFYEHGTWADESLGIYVGWTALPGSFSITMPVTNEQGDVALFFSGEEYSDPAIVEQLRSRGHSVGSSEADYLVHLYEEDPGFIRKLDGMFQGLIVDKARGTAMLFNDRFGMHRVCYHQAKDAFYFAAEAKAIVAVRPELREADPRSLGEIIACGCVLEDRTVFKGISVLPGGSTWSFQHGVLSGKEKYFEPSQWEEQTPLTEDEYFQELRSVLSTVLPRYFAGRQQLGIAMTGGLDTRVILACHPPAPGSLPSYTFGGMFRESQDVRIGRRIAGICQQNHVVIEVGKEFLQGFGGYLEQSIYLSEGTVDAYRAADLYLSKKVRKIAPGKDRRNLWERDSAASLSCSRPRIFQAACWRAISIVKSPSQRTLMRLCGSRIQSPLLRSGNRRGTTMESWHWKRASLTVHSPFLSNEFVRAAYWAPGNGGTGDDVRLRLIRDGSPSSGANSLGPWSRGQRRTDDLYFGKGISGVHIQGGVCLRLRDASICGPLRPLSFRFASGTPVSRPA